LDTTGDVIPALRDEDVLPFAGLTIDTTGELSSAMIGLETLPFDEPIEGAPPLEPAAEFDAPHDALGQTAKLTVAELGLDEPALPFDDDQAASDDLDGTLAVDLDGAPSSLPFDREGTVAAPLLPSELELDEPHPQMGATAAFTLSELGTLEDETLPFDGAPAEATLEPSPPSEAPTLEAGLDGTAFLEPLELGLDDGAVPSSVGKVPPFPTMTLDQFASLQAELAVHPGGADAIRARYHLRDEASQRHLEEHWQARFAASPVERRAFTTKVGQFRRWLEEHRR
jgi:hypothetical protein